MIVLAIINDSLKNELILSKSSSLIECDVISSASQWYLLGLTHENLLLLQVQDGIVDGQIEYHGQFGWYYGGEDEDAPQE